MAKKERVAYHEGGHALVTACTAGADRVHKISIIPRGIGALGFTQQLPTEDRYLMTRAELLGRIDVMLGGRVAEQVVFGELSTGAHNDLQRATDTARAMITEYGMGRTLGPATYPRQQRPVFLGAGEARPAPREYSERTAAQVDDEVKALLEEREARVRSLIEGRREPLERVARRLLEVEVLYAEEFERLAGCGAAPGPVGEAA